MSIFKKIAHKAEALKGGAKKRAGQVTGSRWLRAKGRTDQAKGNHHPQPARGLRLREALLSTAQAGHTSTAASDPAAAISSGARPLALPSRATGGNRHQHLVLAGVHDACAGAPPRPESKEMNLRPRRTPETGP